MNDPNEKLEFELAVLRPRQMSADLALRVESAMCTTSQVWSDRILVFAIGVGSLAACVIVVVLTFGVSATSDVHSTQPLQPIAAATTVGSYSLSHAQNDDAGFNPVP